MAGTEIKVRRPSDTEVTREEKAQRPTRTLPPARIQTRPLVAAIDFGTSYSGVAFSHRNDYSKDRLNITGGHLSTGETSTDKTATAILFNPKEEFDSFGFEAEDKFAKLCVQDAEEAKRWFFFHRFKMVLLTQRESLSSETTLQGYWRRETMPAMTVFSAGIKHLKERVLSRLQHGQSAVEEEDIDWVLTIPAIWEDKAKQFMREVAVMAGIPEKQLTLAFEPEGGTVFCRVESEEAKIRRQPLKFDISEPFTKFLVIDSGGGSVDVTVYEVTHSGTLKELHPPSGGDWGGLKVDEEWKKLLHKILTVRNMMAIEFEELIALEREFEASKKSYKLGQPVQVKIPGSLQVLFRNADLRRYRGDVTLKGSCLELSSAMVESFFEANVRTIISHVRDIIAKPSVDGVDIILLVGGFSRSPILQREVKAAFEPSGVRVVTPANPAPAILMGAVLFGHEPSVIGWRASRFSYGIETSEVFVKGRHPASLRRIVNGVYMCCGIFAAFILAGDIVTVGQETMPQFFQPLRDDQHTVTIQIYRSSDRDCKYVRGCEKVGHVSIDLPPATSRTSRKLAISMQVGMAEVKVFTRDKRTGEMFETTCDFLTQ